MPKKEISAKAATRGLINGFVSYGVLILFIFFSAVVFIAWEIENNMLNTDINVLNITLPIFASIIIFFLIRLICRLSSYDLFHKCKISKNDSSRVTRNINIFFVCLIVLFILLIFFALTIRFNNQRAVVESDINEYYVQFEDAPEYANYLSIEAIESYSTSRTLTLIQTTIIEIGLILGMISLIAFQKKMINTYNDFTIDIDSEKIETHPKASHAV